MKAQDLKNGILQLAIQGKLVEQREEEGTAKELIKQIEAEKEKLIIEGKIKKTKPLQEITKDEISFDIPECWEWVRLGQIFDIIMGQSPKGTSVFEGNSGVEFHQGKVFFGEDYLESSNQSTNKPTKTVEPNTVLLCVRAPVGIVNIATRKICIGRGLCGINTFSEMDAKFVMQILRAFKYDFIRKATGTTFVAITGEVVRNQLFPLPPLGEQKRIVAKIEELMPYVDQYDKAYTEVEELNKKFPEDMQKSILQYAIQGKLVEQREEETAEELYQKIQAEKEKLIKEGKIKKTKPLPEITEDEIPFDIPENWKWVRLGDIISISSGKGLTSKQMLEGDIPVFGGNGVTGYHNIGNVYKKTVVIGRVGYYCGSVHITPTKAWVTDNAFITTYPENHIDRNYLVYILRHLNIGRDNNATAQPVVSGKKIYPIVFPLPPLEEQKRIVKKIEELLPYTKQLVKKLD